MRRSAFFAAALLVFLSGCSGETLFSDVRELGNVDMIQIIGIDEDESGVTVTAGSNMSMTGKAKLYKSREKSLAAALYGMERMPIGKELLMSHTDCVVIGEEAARDGVTEYTDVLVRDTDMRMDTGVFIAKGSSAEDFIKETSSEGASAYDMLEMLKKDVENSGKGHVFTGKYLAAKTAAGEAAFVMAVSLVPSGELDKEGEPAGKMAEPAGFVVIKDGKLAFFLTQEETEGATVVMGKTKSGAVALSVSGGGATVMLKKIKTEVCPEFDDTGSVSRVCISVRADASVISAHGVMISEKTVRDELERELSDRYAGKVRAAVARAQAEDLDFLGLGGMIRRKAPVKFEKMERAGHAWEDVFKDIDFTTDASAKVSGTYDAEDPAEPRGKGVLPWKKTTG